MRPARRIVGGLRHLLPVALCALGGHLALYRSLRPATGDHAYFAWYEPLLFGLSLVAFAAFAALVLAALLGRGALRRAVVRVLLPAARPRLVTVRTARLALAGIGFLVAQESFEQSIAEGRPAVAAFSSAQLLLVLAVLTALAACVALLERSCSQLIVLVAAPFTRTPARAAALSFPPSRPPSVRRRNPLAELRGLRAPPLLG